MSALDSQTAAFFSAAAALAVKSKTAAQAGESGGGCNASSIQLAIHQGIALCEHSLAQS